MMWSDFLVENDSHLMLTLTINCCISTPHRTDIGIPLYTMHNPPDIFILSYISKYTLTRPRPPSLLWSFSRCRRYLKTRQPFSGPVRACQTYPCICIHENKTGKHSEHTGTFYLSTLSSIVTSHHGAVITVKHLTMFLNATGSARRCCSSAKTSRGADRSALARRGHQNRTEATASV